jgi:L-ascorbate metabolism protein UlaG (beta-lactamase superfamily)
MKIKKLSHCCLIVDVSKTRILIDPGSFSIEEHSKLKHADIILITHEHADHFHIESLRELVKRIPDVVVITNDAVGAMLAKEGILHRIMHHGNAVEIKGIRIEAYGTHHALMHRSIPPVSNIGFLLQDKFFFPGDAFTNPGKKVDVLALPVAGPWMKLSEAIDYALEIKPRIAFPVHDGLRVPSQHLIPEKVLGANGIEFVSLIEGESVEVK